MKQQLLAHRPVVVAHRGASVEAPENTLAAFRRALELGAPAMELDVHRTADGELVAIHDATVDRTTNGTGAVAEMTLEALRQLDAGAWKGKAFAGERIPTLAEVCRLARGRASLVVEIKAAGIADQVVATLEAEGVLDESFVISFSQETARRVKELRPDTTVGLLSGKAEDLPLVAELGLDAFCPHHAAATEEMARELHAANRLLSVWTVNDEEGMRRMAALGADLITSDNPALALKVLRRE
ncbi:MAG: glycerophosphodiester phosphodiesterase [Armatimonadetes bacterium]|nr:glycerophosphodiester phosphodiesterase [Armatimonadota bacterium]HOM81079.1 glycerophosphodiester phosphodiesterase family protein [Armatimonadota bacterium]HPO73364.1 glycerophosphodiester phosphodiesterase family protein [Armatimonadota bacterium]